MTMNIFEQAARNKFRFPSKKGDLTTEQLWDLPLTSTAGFDLNTVAKTINTELRAAGEESFVATITPNSTTLAAKLEIVKFVIADKQAYAKAAEDRLAKRQRRAKLMEALEEKDNASINSLSREQILKELDELD